MQDMKTNGRSNSPWANNGAARRRGEAAAGVASRPRGGGARRAGASATLALLALAAAVGVWWMARDGEAEGVPVQEARSGDGKREKATSPRRPKKAARGERKADAVSDADVKRPAEDNAAGVEKPAAGVPVATNAAAAGARPKRLFNSGLEQVAGWIFTARLGDTPPPLPMLPEMTAEKLEEILSAPNPVQEGDSEREADAKRTVAEAKRALAEYLKAGGDVQGFFAHYRGLLVEAHRTWQENQKSIMQAFRENPEEAPALVRRLNAEMAEHGIKPLVVPPMYRDLMDEAGE